MGATAAAFAAFPSAASEERPKKRHIVALSFDDGFKKSSIRTAEIYGKHGLSACINVIASAHMKDFLPPDYPEIPRADFGRWNDLKARGHETMPHGYRHANKRSLPKRAAVRRPSGSGFPCLIHGFPRVGAAGLVLRTFLS